MMKEPSLPEGVDYAQHHNGKFYYFHYGDGCDDRVIIPAHLTARDIYMIYYHMRYIEIMAKEKEPEITDAMIGAGFAQLDGCHIPLSKASMRRLIRAVLMAKCEKQCHSTEC